MLRKSSVVYSLAIELGIIFIVAVMLYGVSYLMSLLTPFPLEYSMWMATGVFILFVMTMIIIDLRAEIQYRKWLREYEEEESNNEETWSA